MEPSYKKISYMSEFKIENQVIKSLKLNEAECSYADFSEMMADGMSAVRSNFEASIFMNTSLLDYNFESANFKIAT